MEEVFDKDQEMVELRTEVLTGRLRGKAILAQVKDHVFWFGIKRSIYVVFLEGLDTENTRFFTTSSGANGYLDWLAGRVERNPQDVDAAWGWPSIKAMAAHFRRHVV